MIIAQLHSFLGVLCSYFRRHVFSLKNYFIFISVLCVYVQMLVMVEAREDIRCPGAGITSNCEPYHVGDGNQTRPSVGAASSLNH